MIVVYFHGIVWLIDHVMILSYLYGKEDMTPEVNDFIICFDSYLLYVKFIDRSLAPPRNIENRWD